MFSLSLSSISECPDFGGHGSKYVSVSRCLQQFNFANFQTITQTRDACQPFSSRASLTFDFSSNNNNTHYVRLRTNYRRSFGIGNLVNN